MSFIILYSQTMIYLRKNHAGDTVVSKFVGPVGQSDISYECPTKNVGVPDQMSDRNYKKNIHLMDEKRRNISDYI